MKRRDFFKLGVRKTARIAADMVSEKIAGRTGRWLRPPFALEEPDFLLACTRCDKCIEACDYDVVFPLPARFGLQVSGTPAMDLLDRGCRMCPDWPCVTACEPDALKLPRPGEECSSPRVRLARVRIDTRTCLPYSGPECGACAQSCPVPGALEWEGGLRPVINEDLCTGCALCREACIMEPKAIEVSVFVSREETAEIS